MFTLLSRGLEMHSQNIWCRLWLDGFRFCASVAAAILMLREYFCECVVVVAARNITTSPHLTAQRAERQSAPLARWLLALLKYQNNWFFSKTRSRRRCGASVRLCVWSAPSTVSNVRRCAPVHSRFLHLQRLSARLPWHKHSANSARMGGSLVHVRIQQTHQTHHTPQDTIIKAIGTNRKRKRKNNHTHTTFCSAQTQYRMYYLL